MYPELCLLPHRNYHLNKYKQLSGRDFYTFYKSRYIHDYLLTINEQILKFAQNYPTISKTASSDAPFFMKV